MDSTTGNLEPGPAPEGSAFSPGSLIGRYRILRPLGRGGMGEVYLAVDPTLDTRVALKRVAHDLGFDPAHRERILHEARRASRVSDPRLAGVLNVVEHRGEVVLVMEFVDGVSVRDRLGAPLPLDSFWGLAEDCVKAIESAHRQGLVHRDLKPENIMITPAGQVKILDFGIARRLARAEDTTTLMTVGGEGRISGTPSYMSPEAYRDDVLDQRTDIFSLGVVFYEMLAGHRPFLGETAAIVAGKILHEEPTPLHVANPGVPRSLSTVIGKMLVKDRDRRYPDARAVLDDLMAARRGETVSGPDPLADTVTLGRRRSWTRWVPAVVPAAGLVLFLVLGGPARVSDRLGWTPLPEHPNVAVLPVRPPVEVVGADAGVVDANAYGLGLTEVLTGDLARRAGSGPLQVAAFGDVTQHGVSGPAAAREWLGATLALSTRLTYRDRRIRVDCRLIDTASGRAVRRERLDIPGEEQERLLGELSRGYARMLGLPETGLLVPALVGGAGTERFYLQGLGKAARAWGQKKEDQAPEFRAAIEDLQLAHLMETTFAEALARMAECRIGLFKVSRDPAVLDTALTNAETAVRSDTTSAVAYRARGQVLLALERRSEAQRDFARAAALDSTDDESIYEAARAYGRRGEKEQELAAFRRAVEARPHYWKPRWWLGVACNRQARFDEAAENFRAVIELAPEYYLGYSTLGAMYLKEGNYAEAIEFLQRSNALHPTAASFSNLGTAYFGDRRFAEAAETYNKSLRFNDQEYALWLNLGDAYFWGGDTTGARQAYEEGIRQGTAELARRAYDHTLAADLGMLYAFTGKADSARVFLGRAREGDPDGAAVNYSLALAYWALEEPDSAFAALARALEAGFPRVPIEKWIVFDAWREDPRYRAILETAQTSDTGGS